MHHTLRSRVSPLRPSVAMLLPLFVACSSGASHTTGSGAQAVAASAACPSLTGTSGSIVDPSGHVWTLTADGNGGLVVDENGAPAGFTAWVAELVIVAGTVSHRNTSGQWYAWNGSGWTAEGDPTASCTAGGSSSGGSGSSSSGGMTGSCATLTGTSGSIADPSGNVWTLTTGGDGGLIVDENGAPAGFTAWVVELVIVNGTVSHRNASAQWYAWNGSGWTAENDPTASCSGGGSSSGGSGSGGGTGTYGSLFFDDFVQSTPPVGPKGNATTWLSRFPFGGAEYLNGDGNVAYMCDPSAVGSNPGAIGYNPFHIGGGVLTIQAQSVASSGITNPAGTAWNSGTITSCDEDNGVPAPGLFATAHGYFEVRAKWPKGGVEGTPGWWPGVVLYPLPYNGQDMPGEIDFPECLGGDTSRSEWTIHPGPGTHYYGPGPIDLGDGSWHTVGVDVQPNTVDFYMDGTKIFSNTPASTWNPNQQWYFNLTMEVSQVGTWGGGLPNVPSPGGPDPASWKLDYAGCWQDFATRQAQGPVRAPSSP